ncbi:hypothetical protein [Algoriphagus aquimarinus]|uniref:DUF2971 domain-containing protein n=1 Tax=Algoriphagus aquimarinus TaxID=237018 RepID=A0A1I1AUL3_9BACT|nr:hypothetical protein [Algoriphagus aquimarinus]SFB40020.1 hypothetical protein SAMN04489723_10927 [Algoriphagus aquimarinus]
MIYHYTSIDTLKLILESKKIRFNNLNAVDDELEGELFVKKSLAQLIFVSCWTTDPNENIPLWKMYASTRGVRIGLPDYPWRKVDCKKWDAGVIEVRYDPSEEYFSPFDIDEIFGESHYIIPPFSLPISDSNAKKAFSKEVIYLPERELKIKYSDHYNEKLTKPGHAGLIMKPIDFGLYKHEQWAFQKEFRFVLFISPMDKEINLSAKNFHQPMVNSLMKYIQAEYISPIKDFFVKIDPNSIENMEITLGPHCTEEDIRHVQSMRQKHGIVGDLYKSGVRLRR